MVLLHFITSLFSDVDYFFPCGYPSSSSAVRCSDCSTADLWSCNPFFEECPAALTLNAALGDAGDDQASIDLPRVFTIMDGWSNAVEETCLYLPDGIEQT